MGQVHKKEEVFKTSSFLLRENLVYYIQPVKYQELSLWMQSGKNV